jgi:hypothetical protein
LTVTTALPLAVPLQFASLMAVTAYDDVDDGLTLRDAVVPLLIVCVTLSDQVTLQGAVPVSVAVIDADPPGQMALEPLTDAVGFAFTVTAVGVDVALQPLALVTLTL